MRILGLSFALLASIVAIPCPSWAAWEQMSNSELNNVCNDQRWHAMEQSLVRAGYTRASDPIGGKMWTGGEPSLLMKDVTAEFRNPGANHYAVVSYITGVDDNDNYYEFYAYTVITPNGDGVLIDVNTWDTPANQTVGDDSRIVAIFKGYVACMSWGMTGAGIVSAIGGPMAGIAGAIGVSYGCFGAAHGAWIATHP